MCNQRKKIIKDSRSVLNKVINNWIIVTSKTRTSSNVTEENRETPIITVKTPKKEKVGSVKDKEGRCKKDKQN